MLDAEREGDCLGRKEAESESDGKGKKCETGGPDTSHKPMTESSACGQSQEVQRRSKDLEADLALSVDRAMELEKLVTDLKDELASGHCLVVSKRFLLNKPASNAKVFEGSEGSAGFCSVLASVKMTSGAGSSAAVLSLTLWARFQALMCCAKGRGSSWDRKYINMARRHSRMQKEDAE